MVKDLEKRYESIVYAVFWGTVFAAVPVGMLVWGGDGVHWRGMLRAFLKILPFLLLFLAHDQLAAPLMVRRSKPWAWLGVTLLLVAAFGFAVWEQRPAHPREGFPGPPPMEMAPPPEGAQGGLPPLLKGGGPGPERTGPPLGPNVLKLSVGILLVMVNLGVKLYFKSVRDERRLHDLQAENLSRQLEALSYQISPHFFMNTLNNIHALVDIDPEKAKGSIEDFSVLMRYALYEGGKPLIPLGRELEFLRHFVTLMRMRYPEQVRIRLSVPDKVEGAQLPPLVLASFVENAFKHGVSYARPSFVDVSLTEEGGKIVFRCVNSRQESAPAQGGVGLQNVRKRLDLLYGEDYTLYVGERENVYDVLLVLPSRSGEKEEGA